MNNRKKVLIHCLNASGGGYNIQKVLARGIKKQYETAILTTIDLDAEPQSEIAERCINMPNILMIRKLSLIGWLLRWFYLSIFFMTRDWDVLIATHWHLGGFPSAITRRILGRRNVIFVTANLFNFTWAGRLEKPFLQAMLNLTMRLSDVVIVVDYSYRDYLDSINLGSKTILWKGGNWIDTKEMQRKDRDIIRNSLRLSEEDVVIIFIGQISTRDGADTVTDLFIKLSKERDNLKLILLGKGVLKNQILQRLRDANITEKLIQIGWVEHRKVAMWLSASDIMINPLRSPQGGAGNNIGEAMACKVPVISSSVGAIRLVIDNGKNGFLVKEDDFPDMEEKLKHLIDDKGLRKKMGEEGRRKIESEYSTKVLATLSLSTLGNLVRNNGSN